MKVCGDSRLHVVPINAADEGALQYFSLMWNASPKFSGRLCVDFHDDAEGMAMDVTIADIEWFDPEPDDSAEVIHRAIHAFVERVNCDMSSSLGIEHDGVWQKAKGNETSFVH